MIQIVDRMVIINLDLFFLVIRANILEISLLALILTLYFLGGVYDVSRVPDGQNDPEKKDTQERAQ